MPRLRSIERGRSVAVDEEIRHGQARVALNLPLDRGVRLHQARVREVLVDVEDRRTRGGAGVGNARRSSADRSARQSPVNVSDTMLMPLFECAVPSMIDGVRP